MNLSDFDYDLPPELIAREPVRPRDASRMMVLDRRTGQYADSAFRKLPEFLGPSDTLVLNDTRVIQLEGGRDESTLSADTGAPSPAIPEIDSDTEEGAARFAAAGPGVFGGDRIRPGDRFVCGEGEFKGVFGESRNDGLRLLEFESSKPVEDLLERHGHVPLPPYIDREDTAADAADYQTVYASVPGAVAAPTAGLHFTESTFDALQSRGVEILKITLHVGIGTFIPVRTEDPAKHALKPERFEVTERTASRLNAAREAGRRIVAAGTTTTRTLEYVVQRYGRLEAQTGETDLFIVPGHDFKVVNALLTNFHLPRSTLLMLVSAFTSREAILQAYRHAVQERYRFYSYGDCMLIL